MSAHAKLGPSAAKRWLDCTGSVALIDKIVDELGELPPAGEAAEQGTACHMAAEECLRTGEDPASMVGRTFNGIQLEPDHIDYFEPYVDYIREMAEAADYVELEQRLVMIPDLVWGTADAVILKEGTLIVADLKTGFHRVEAEDNPQLLLYALGALEALELIHEVKRIQLVISQARIGNFSVASVSLEEMRFFKAYLMQRVNMIQSGQTELVPSDEACQYCPARGICPALREYAMQEAQRDFAGMDNPMLADAWSKLPLLEHYISGVKASIMERLEKGQNVPGLKLVEGRRTRDWGDVLHAKQYLSRRIPSFTKEAYNHTFKSPAQIEKVVKIFGDQLHKPVTDAMLQKLVVSRPGKPTIAPEDDRRPEVVYGQRAAADFAGVALTDETDETVETVKRKPL